MESKPGPTVLYEVPASRSAILGGIRIVLVSLPLGLLIGAVLTFGSEFLWAAWPAWVMLALLGLAALLALLQFNRFGVYLHGIAPPYKPWRMWSFRRLVVPITRIREVSIRSTDDPYVDEIDREAEYDCILTLTDGGTIAFNSYGPIRGMRRQTQSNLHLVRARRAIVDFAARVLLR